MGGTQPEGGVHSKHIGLPQPRSGDVKGGTGSGQFLVGVTCRVSAGGERRVVWRRGWSRAWRGSVVPRRAFVSTVWLVIFLTVT